MVRNEKKNENFNIFIYSGHNDRDIRMKSRKIR